MVLGIVDLKTRIQTASVLSLRLMMHTDWGLDPVASPFVCLGLALSVSIGGLGGRDVRRYVDGKG